MPKTNKRFLVVFAFSLLGVLACRLISLGSDTPRITVSTFTPGPSTSPELALDPTSTVTYRTISTNTISIKATVTPNNLNTTSEPYDLSNAESIVALIQLALTQGNSGLLLNLLLSDTVLYGSGLASSREKITRDQFIMILSERIGSHPTCEGYFVGTESIIVWTKGWYPVLKDAQGAESDELVFQIHVPVSSENLVSAYFFPSSSILEVIDNARPCPAPIGE